MMDVDQGDFSFDDQLLYYIRRKKDEKARGIMKSLIDPVSKVDSLGNTLLHYVAQCTNDAMLKYLINLGAKIDVQNREGRTPLMLAIDSYYRRFDYEECKQKTVLTLLDASANMHIRDNQGQSPLSRALFMGNSIVSLWLFGKLNSECLGNNDKFAQRLIEANSSVYAVLCLKNAELTRLLLSSGCPVEPPHPIGYAGTTLQASIRKNDVENVRALLDHGVDPNAESVMHATPMFAYSLNYTHCQNRYDDKNPEILQLLLDSGANPVKILTKTIDYKLRNKMQMYGVLRSCDWESIRVLLDHNVDLNARDGYGYTALHYVTENERPNVLDEFEGMDFDINARCNEGLTPLLYAVFYHGKKLSVNLLKFLLHHGADPNAKDRWGMTALMHLCRFNFVGIGRSCGGCKHIEKIKRSVEYLLQHGADPQVVTLNGLTAFNNDKLHCRVYPVESVLAHLAMLEETGTPIKEIIRDQIDKNEKYKNTFLTCRAQLEAMKEIKICKSLTLRELLFGKETKIKRYLREDGFVLKLSRLSNKYGLIPYYRYAMRERISRIVYSLRLKKVSAVVMAKVTGIDFEGYPIILDKICSYLTQKDLINFCRII